ncbi:hypothetical protein HDU97_000316 [Phlyctochytrium planicorne]|nr:hypothetical protein HDU97_000316 [Phlyctochytrium planicorne]
MDSRPRSSKSRRPNKTGDPLLDRRTTISKALAYILRHGAVKENIPIRTDGYVKLTDLVKFPKLRNVTFKEIMDVVENNEKKRFHLVEEEEDGWLLIQHSVRFHPTVQNPNI